MIATLPELFASFLKKGVCAERAEEAEMTLQSLTVTSKNGAVSEAKLFVSEVRSKSFQSNRFVSEANFYLGWDVFGRLDFFVSRQKATQPTGKCWGSLQNASAPEGPRCGGGNTVECPRQAGEARLARSLGASGWIGGGPVWPIIGLDIKKPEWSMKLQ